MRKRDTKAEGKNESGVAKKKEGEDRFDDQGKFIMEEKDYSDP
jgi:hypothetical protein